MRFLIGLYRWIAIYLFFIVSSMRCVHICTFAQACLFYELVKHSIIMVLCANNIVVAMTKNGHSLCWENFYFLLSLCHPHRLLFHFCSFQFEEYTISRTKINFQSANAVNVLCANKTQCK